MGIAVALNHKTRYQYDRPVSLSPQVIRLRPASHCRTRISSYSLNIKPKQYYLNWQQDPFGNYLARVVFTTPTREFQVEVDLVAELTVLNPFDFFLEPEAETYPFTYEPTLAKELIPYLELQPAGSKLQALIDTFKARQVRTVDFLVEINSRLKDDIGYVVRLEPGVQTCEETLSLATGSCRDSAWVLVQLLRHLGLAARFVSGYLIQLTPDVKPLEGSPGPEKDFTDLHAWAEVYLPGAGWIGLDPTSGLLANEGHIPLACTADPLAAAPVSGSFGYAKDQGSEQGECKTDFTYSLSVMRIQEAPRVTLPYSEGQWHDIESLGHQIDEQLQEDDVRLTMGGEPTFVSIDDMEGAEWTTAPLGPRKRKLADALLKRLRDRFTKGAMLHYGQGKLYPGESLPRWALGCYWRKDGVAVWENPALIADETRNYGYGIEQAEQFVTALGERLGVNSAFRLPAYEDVWHYLMKEARLPANVDPLKNNLEDPEERKRLARVFEQGLRKVVGYALPLRREHDSDTWVSTSWVIRREHLYLVPGDAPMGYRLPLDTLPWLPPEQADPVIELDPFASRSRLPGGNGRTQPRITVESQGGPISGIPEQRLHRSPTAAIRTALCVEPRDGRLYLFMPPQRYLEDYLDLIAAVEATAAELQMPVLVEGYSPPADHRLQRFTLTPDPGVLEVNIHPAQNWEELVTHTTILYEEARKVRLGTEKFMIDGRHTGTGGGNHVVVGGATPADSPILRRPDLLRSLIGFWHNHPSLSYLFSGLFLGPTSQAPRMDETRSDSVYEMEIAFRQVPEGDCPPWLTDRIFRHLLVDVTGNSHRAEFCIDKLYSPDTSTGRLGLLEMRGFEMPPHPRMSLVQQLLVRALIGHFWNTPYTRPLVRWGSEIHDRFMLPHFVEQDFQEVLFDLRETGLPFQSEWFNPHFAFRFPAIGGINQRGIVLELRQALEPWYVLGEESAGGGPVRFVDSSVERLQLKVRGMTDSRHVVLCAGRRVPLHPTGVNGEFVAGVRFRAWQPPSCLHPTIPVHSPLVFDIMDLWTERSIGGCTYHTAHPGGRSFDTFPVNASEAESRRATRFFPYGHTPGPMKVIQEDRRPEYPLTLDLRQPAPASAVVVAGVEHEQEVGASG